MRETKRVVQVGVQQRSLAHFVEAKQRFFDSGMIGHVNMVRTVWNANGGYLETPSRPAWSKKPDGLDWDAVLGWLPEDRPWDPKRYFNRFAYWDFSTGGQTGGLFVHMVDVVHWYLEPHARRVRRRARAASINTTTAATRRTTSTAIVEYPQNVNVTFEATITDMIGKESADIVFHGSGGRLNIFRYGYRFLPADGKRTGEITATGRARGRPHGQLAAIASARASSPTPTSSHGHYGAMSCHMGNMAYKQSKRACLAARSGTYELSMHRRQHGIHPLRGQSRSQRVSNAPRSSATATWSRWCTTAANC